MKEEGLRMAAEILVKVLALGKTTNSILIVHPVYEYLQQVYLLNLS